MYIVTIDSGLGGGESRRQREERIFELGLNDQEPDMQRHSRKTVQEKQKPCQSLGGPERSLMMLV